MREEQAEQMNSTPSVLPQPCVFIPGPADAQREVKSLGDPDLRRQCPVMAATVGEPRLDSNNPTHSHPPPHSGGQIHGAILPETAMRLVPHPDLSSLRGLRAHTNASISDLCSSLRMPAFKPRTGRARESQQLNSLRRLKTVARVTECLIAAF